MAHQHTLPSLHSSKLKTTLLSNFYPLLPTSLPLSSPAFTVISLPIRVKRLWISWFAFARALEFDPCTFQTFSSIQNLKDQHLLSSTHIFSSLAKFSSTLTPCHLSKLKIALFSLPPNIINIRLSAYLSTALSPQALNTIPVWPNFHPLLSLNSLKHLLFNNAYPLLPTSLPILTSNTLHHSRLPIDFMGTVEISSLRLQLGALQSKFNAKS